MQLFDATEDREAGVGRKFLDRGADCCAFGEDLGHIVMDGELNIARAAGVKTKAGGKN